MEIQPRRDILELWRATVNYCYRDEKWTWGDPTERNSVSDAEQLLTILYPATIIASLGIGAVDETADDVREHLHELGNELNIPRRLVEFITEYMRTYLIDNKTPDFSGGSYFQPVESGGPEVASAQRQLNVVDSYSMSLTLCLSTLEFLRVYKDQQISSRTKAEITVLEGLCKQRLSAAMVGLLRGFTVNAFPPDSLAGKRLCNMANQTGTADDIVVKNLLDMTSDIRTTIQTEVEVGVAKVSEKLDNRYLFECGWSWGVVADAPDVQLASEVEIGDQPTGYAEDRPYLYFTVAALDGIQDLFSEETRLRGLLDVEQQRLARALQTRSDVTRRFWARIATYATDRSDRWPIEDLPWTTSDGAESDHHSLLLTSMILLQGSETLDSEGAERTGRLLERLAERGLITYRAAKNDETVQELHAPGVQLNLVGSEKAVADGPMLRWTVPSYSSLLLKRLLRVAELLDDNAARITILDLADLIWRHIKRRQINGAEARGLWDQPAGVYSRLPRATAPQRPSWHQTERVMEALVAAAQVTELTTSAASVLLENARQTLAEAEHLFDQEQLRGTDDTGEEMRKSFQVVTAKLRRARRLLLQRPATAHMLAYDVLRELDSIDAARQDTRSG